MISGDNRAIWRRYYVVRALIGGELGLVFPPRCLRISVGPDRSICPHQAVAETNDGKSTHSNFKTFYLHFNFRHPNHSLSIRLATVKCEVKCRKFVIFKLLESYLRKLHASTCNHCEVGHLFSSDCWLEILFSKLLFNYKAYELL